jgi:SAM-dependent methyltransferase
MPDSENKDKFHKFDIEKTFDVDSYLYFYDLTRDDEYAQNQVDFIIREAEIKSGMKLLDLACGHGRHANKLAAIGCDVTGIDITEGFLDFAREKAKESGVTVKYINADIRDISHESEFDRITLLFTAFGYFSDNENLDILKRIELALKPGGRFIFDIQNRDRLLKAFLPYSVSEKDNNYMLDIHDFDIISGRMSNRRFYLKDGKKTLAEFSLRLYTFTEISLILSLAGLKVSKVFGNWEGQPLTRDTFRMILICEKMS